MSSSLYLPPLVVAAVLLSACVSPTDTEGRREVAVIPPELLAPPHLVLPDTARAGTILSFRVTAGGPNGCYRADGVEVSRAGARVQVTPYHRVVSGMCPQAPVTFAYTVDVPVAGPGPLTLEVVARATRDARAPVVIASKRVVVQPQ